MSSPIPRGTWRLWRLGGVDYLVRPSLLVMGAVLVVVFTQRFEGHTESSPLVLATGFVVGLYVSVLVHEIAHVVAARAFGQRVRSVTLHLLGGETAIEGESRTPWQELVTAVVGPLASLGIGVAFLVAERSTTGTTADLSWTLGTVNLFVAAFNMIPGLPLDGGRVLRAVIWALTRREAWGTRVAGWIGRLTAIGLVVVAATRTHDPGWLVQLVVAVLIAAFLWTGAGQAIRHADRDGRVNRLVARDVARDGDAPADAEDLDADLHGTDLLREIASRPAAAYRVVEADGTVVGVLTLDDLDTAYRATSTEQPAG